MLTSQRLPRIIAVALVAVAALLCVPGAAAPASAHSGPPGPVAVRTLAVVIPAGGGLCSVPGIGDIGGLLGFCSLGSSGLTGSLNNLCQPGVPQPESATSGVDSLIKPPAAGRQLATPYNQYGMSGQFWAATNLQCSDMTSLIGNDVAGMLFDFAKAIDRVTITVYQSAAGEGILSWLQGVTDHLITGLGNAIYFPYVAVVVILGAIWLAWQGLIRKRGTRTIEGTVWMVLACAAAIWLIGRPADFTGLGKGVSDGISTTLNTAFAHLPNPGQASCLPVTKGDPQISPASFSYTSGRTVVDQNANALWTVLVCKPWLDGEFGTTAFGAPGGRQTLVNTYGRQLLWAQAIAANERPTTALIQAKQAAYVGIGQTIQQNDPSVYPLFQGKEWTTRLELAFAALLAAVVAGVLILLMAVTLILLKLGFLLLLIVGPFFLLIGTHPGFGRVVAVRWFEMLVGVLLKQAAVALALSVLLYCYALIMGTADSVLPWALKILMITLVTVAVVIYRKPFQHLFAAVGYGALGSTERADADLSRAAATARANTRDAATFAVPGFAAYRAARWARRNPAQAANLALGTVTAGSTAGLAASAAAHADAAGHGGGDFAGSAAGGPHDPANPGAAAGSQAGASSRARAWGASAGTASAHQAPPLRLPPRQGTPTSWMQGGSSGAGASAGRGGSNGGSNGGSGGGSNGGSGGGSGGAGPSPPAAAPALPPLVRSSGAASGGRPAGGPPGPRAGARPRQAGSLWQGQSSRSDRLVRPASTRQGSNGDLPGTSAGSRPGGPGDDSAAPFWIRSIWRRK
ncbi:MAG TPA: type IV secretion system protein [Streptosporangiaceae bacterium]|nr:type IV secretion system protein [Streptosporangiaceae bacterium]